MSLLQKKFILRPFNLNVPFGPGSFRWGDFYMDEIPVLKYELNMDGSFIFVKARIEVLAWKLRRCDGIKVCPSHQTLFLYNLPARKKVLFFIVYLAPGLRRASFSKVK